MNEWQPIQEKIGKLNDFDPKVREFRRYFLNGATILELDSAGRLNIPKNLMAHAGLDKDIVLTAANNKIEIWDKQKYQEFFDNFSPESFSSLAQQVMTGATGQTLDCKTAHMEPSQYHLPVLLHEVVANMDIRADGTYVDATFGGGGHSRAILEKLGHAGQADRVRPG